MVLALRLGRTTGAPPPRVVNPEPVSYRAGRRDTFFVLDVGVNAATGFRDKETGVFVGDLGPSFVFEHGSTGGGPSGEVRGTEPCCDR